METAYINEHRQGLQNISSYVLHFLSQQLSTNIKPTLERVLILSVKTCSCSITLWISLQRPISLKCSSC